MCQTQDTESLRKDYEVKHNDVEEAKAIRKDFWKYS